MYVVYLDHSRQEPNLVRYPMNHLQFKNAFCEALLERWRRRNEIKNNALILQPSIHMPSHTILEEATCCLQNLHTSHILLSMWLQNYVLERKVL
jgi:hypothetical protein